MKRISLLAALAVTALAALAAGCGGGGGKPANNAAGGGGAAALTRPPAPEPYAGKTNSKTSDADVAEGQKIFAGQCALCHGEKGDGDAAAGKALNPPASDLTDPKLQEVMKDDYMFWHIMEGGAALGHTGMTPFKDSLKEDQIWQVISYIRTLKKK